jgi:multiple sugar transport system substrate-binding protein
VRESAEFAEVLPQADIAAGSAEYVFFPPSVPGITDAYGPLDEAVSALLAGSATDIQAELDNAADRANQILEQNRATYTTPSS